MGVCVCVCGGGASCLASDVSHGNGRRGGGREGRRKGRREKGEKSDCRRGGRQGDVGWTFPVRARKVFFLLVIFDYVPSSTWSYFCFETRDVGSRMCFFCRVLTTACVS